VATPNKRRYQVLPDKAAGACHERLYHQRFPKSESGAHPKLLLRYRVAAPYEVQGAIAPIAVIRVPPTAVEKYYSCWSRKTSQRPRGRKVNLSRFRVQRSQTRTHHIRILPEIATDQFWSNEICRRHDLTDCKLSRHETTPGAATTRLLMYRQFQIGAQNILIR
jgi:hypothetical protein